VFHNVVCSGLFPVGFFGVHINERCTLRGNGKMGQE
jgi:hypothetical protein